MKAGIDQNGFRTDTPPAEAERLPGPWALAGLVDAHCHLSIALDDDAPAGSRPLGVSRTRRNPRAAQQAGITLVPGMFEAVTADDLAHAARAQIAAGTPVELIGDFPAIDQGVTRPDQATPTYPIKPSGDWWKQRTPMEPASPPTPPPPGPATWPQPEWTPSSTATPAPATTCKHWPQTAAP
ncbi:hypothetical protein [Actinomadura nitritigenes]|uniref:hypothetical protein n=1 Tax=Actinomadura nitritigenes TaxID=134602 RepID=UPI003D8F16D6